MARPRRTGGSVDAPDQATQVHQPRGSHASTRSIQVLPWRSCAPTTQAGSKVERNDLLVRLGGPRTSMLHARPDRTSSCWPHLEQGSLGSGSPPSETNEPPRPPAVFNEARSSPKDAVVAAALGRESAPGVKASSAAHYNMVWRLALDAVKERPPACASAGTQGRQAIIDHDSIRYRYRPGSGQKDAAAQRVATAASLWSQYALCCAPESSSAVARSLAWPPQQRMLPRAGYFEAGCPPWTDGRSIVGRRLEVLCVVGAARLP
ncbi:uncharacterized protein PFL1_04513 [Pseudozyma flocculosa PF-1]|uniref:Uncharacterized protein n=1 Tax=Pseudozyma flocculosa PF-1 TaxID=1277687 RepID=A0A061H4E9_9BASI|nr:uncharacterized protein PFL1_04513 [Pseudozyma flocculosa PF-1]EPQ27767.1 hypothetical protein PFL1_04513 [Pseudozyma flocculosa PF-1]